MRSPMPIRSCLLPALLLIPASALAQAPVVDDLLPQWKLGDRWTVETASRPLHVRSAPPDGAPTAPLCWQFAVRPSGEPSDPHWLCIEVACQSEARAIPKTVFWVHRDSCALRRITTYLPTPGGFQELTMSYDSPDGQASPILGPLSAVPIDTPVLYAGTKGLQTFTYTSHVGSEESKQLGDVGFAHQVEQHLSEMPADEVRKLFGAHFAKSLTSDAFSKSLTEQPVTEVRLKSQGREIRQLWQPHRPWPIYSDNGYTVSRLVSVERQEDRS